MSFSPPRLPGEVLEPGLEKFLTERMLLGPERFELTPRAPCSAEFIFTALPRRRTPTARRTSPRYRGRGSHRPARQQRYSRGGQVHRAGRYTERIRATFESDRPDATSISFRPRVWARSGNGGWWSVGEPRTASRPRRSIS
jgi:hypothetical protein